MLNLLKSGKKLVLAAPMADYTDSIYRQFAKIFGADATFTEMVNAEGFARCKEGLPKIARFVPEETPLVLQLFSANPYAVGQAAQKATQYGFAAIDLNMGCPMKRITKKGAGSALLADKARAKEMVAAALESKMPVSVKVRSGVNSNDEWEKILAMLVEFEKMGIAFATVHPRTAAQMYSGQSDWSLIAQAARELKIPVFGSGDIFSAASAAEMVKTIPVAGVMLARGAVANFQLFAQVRAAFDGKSIPDANFYVRAQTMLEFFGREFEYRGKERAAGWCRKFLAKILRDFPGARQMRARLSKIASLDDVQKFLNDACRCCED